MVNRRDVSASSVPEPAPLSAPVATRRSKTPETANPGPALAPDLSLAISYISPSELIEYPNNPREHSPNQIQQIAETIKASGFVSPLIVDHDRVLIAGHGRLAASKLLHLERIPVVRLDHLNDAQKRALRIADNRLAELAGWDLDLLAIEFSSLIEMDGNTDLNFDLEVTGFSFGAIDQTIEAAKKCDAPDPDDCFEPNFEGPTVSRLGDRWLLGEHSILCGDARDSTVHACALDGLLAQAAICDPLIM